MVCPSCAAVWTWFINALRGRQREWIRDGHLVSEQRCESRLSRLDRGEIDTQCIPVVTFSLDSTELALN